MSAKRKLQVFVSSTYVDMRKERQAAVEAILLARHIPAGMELFAAGDESQMEVIRQWIDDSDAFMLILGGRYGSIEQKSGKSYIQLEYEYAIKKKKPLFAAVISETCLNAKVQSDGKSVIETDNGPALKEFRQTVTQKMCRFFDDVKDLKLIVLESLSHFDQDTELVGWVRGSEAFDAKATLEQITKLQERNEALKGQIGELQAAISTLRFPSSQEPIEDSLSEEARILLIDCRNDNKSIYYAAEVSRAVMQIGGRNYIKPSDSLREHARWKGALESLITHSLVERSHFTGYYMLTTAGFQVADRIQASKGTSPVISSSSP